MKKRILSLLLPSLDGAHPPPPPPAGGGGGGGRRTRIEPGRPVRNTPRSMTRPAAIPKGQRKFPVPMNTRRNVIVS